MLLMNVLPARASGLFPDGIQRLAPSMIFYSGSKDESFSGATGFGLEGTLEKTGAWLGVFGKVRLDFASGSAYFVDGSSRSLAFTYLSGTASFGAKINLVPARHGRLHPYVSGAGDLGVGNLSFASSSLTSLQESETSLLFGYTIAIGAEIYSRNGDPKSGLWFIEAQMQDNGGTLAGQAFSVSGFRVLFGLGW